MQGRILLISVNQCHAPYPVFPLGLAHVDSALRRAGFETFWHDRHAEQEPVASLVARVQPDFIGISLRNIDDVVIKKRETYFGELLVLCRELRSITSRPIILGGSGFSIFPKRLLELSGAEFGIQGEGESSLTRLIAALMRGEDFSHIPGLVFRRNGSVIANSQRADLASDEIFAGDRPSHLVEFYLRKSSMLNVQTQRGCAFHCCYCTYPVIEGKCYRRRGPDSVIDELRQLKAAGVKYFFIVDSIFNSSLEHAMFLSEAMIRAELDLRWGCFMRPKNLTRELMRTMARAGLAHIEFGSDSFCDSVLKAYGKNFSFDDILLSSELARAERIDFCHFLVSGGPGETAQTLEHGFENSLLLKDAVMLALVGMRIYPGTPLFQRAVREKRIAADADLLDPAYYISSELTEEEIFKQLRDFSQRSRNWIVGEPNPNYMRMADSLRARGVVGPLWSYFALMQRLTEVGAPFQQTA